MSTKIKIVSSDGNVWDTQFDPAVTIQNIKQQAVEHFYSADAFKSLDDFKVLYPEGFRSLTETHAIQDEKLKDNDVLLITRRRKIVFNDVLRDSDLKAPTKEQIIAATKNLSSSHLPSAENSCVTAGNGTTAGPSAKIRSDTECLTDEVADFQLDFRKIMISLINKMGTMLHGNPDLQTICNQMKIKITKRLETAQKSSEGTTASVLLPAPDFPATPAGIIQGLIEAKKREFRPNQKAYDALKELGFEEIDILDALRGNKNNKDLAAEWLLKDKANRLIADDVKDGLSPNSHILKALVEYPAIRLGLHNPKTLLACFEILESTGNSTMWLTDQDIGPVLGSIFKVYHAEKHSEILD